MAAVGTRGGAEGRCAVNELVHNPRHLAGISVLWLVASASALQGSVKVDQDVMQGCWVYKGAVRYPWWSPSSEMRAGEGSTTSNRTCVVQ